MRYLPNLQPPVLVPNSCPYPTMNNPAQVSPRVLKRVVGSRSFQRKLSGHLRKKVPIGTRVPGEPGGYMNFIGFVYKPKSYFDDRSFRFLIPPSNRAPYLRTRVLLGCKKGFWGAETSRCKKGTETHKILIPIQRVMALISRKGMSKIKKPARLVANPLLMAVANPLLMTVQNKPMRSSPFKEDKSIPIKMFENWLYKNGSAEEIGRYKAAKKAYKRFHLGASPVSVSKQMLNIGTSKKVIDREFTYSMGVSPKEYYTPPKSSGKAPHAYVHDYKTKPQAAVSPHGKVIIKQLKGTAKIDDWMRG